MPKTTIRKAFYVTAMTLALISAAQAAVVRSFVNAETGSDSNTATNCVATTPCHSFAAAYTVTQSGGEIVAMSPGGYGPITITTPLTITGVDGAAVTATSGTTAITINASGSTVIIRNLQITGYNTANSTGIAVIDGSLILENSALKFLTTGISVTNTKATLFHVDIMGNGTGVSASGSGVNTGNHPLTGTTEVLLFFGSAFNNTTAYFMTNPGSGSFSILEFISSPNTIGPGFTPPYTTSMGGNGTLVSGTGTGCPCNTLGLFTGDNNAN